MSAHGKWDADGEEFHHAPTCPFVTVDSGACACDHAPPSAPEDEFMRRHDALMNYPPPAPEERKARPHQFTRPNPDHCAICGMDEPAEQHIPAPPERLVTTTGNGARVVNVKLLLNEPKVRELYERMEEAWNEMHPTSPEQAHVVVELRPGERIVSGEGVRVLDCEWDASVVKFMRDRQEKGDKP